MNKVSSSISVFFKRSRMMNKDLEMAIDLRNKGNLKESNAILIKMANDYPNDAGIHYHCAWSFDVLGEESAAVPFYEKAIQLGLSDKDLVGAILGLGSTYRTLGEYEKSKDTLHKGIERFPNNRALQVFYSMTLYNLSEHKAAMEILLQCLSETTKDQDILSYKRAIEFYSNKLDTTWK
jgi:tetratricopeptide (TPR) repeat protein